MPEGFFGLKFVPFRPCAVRWCHFTTPFNQELLSVWKRLPCASSSLLEQPLPPGTLPFLVELRRKSWSERPQRTGKLSSPLPVQDPGVPLREPVVTPASGSHGTALAPLGPHGRVTVSSISTEVVQGRGSGGPCARLSGAGPPTGHPARARLCKRGSLWQASQSPPRACLLRDPAS